eukprot:TRINITY_DN1549_c0_g1_i1.p1 TRINITY_DN1549_c0_g1~~TRINITY_DN1549_c0_g1_i1.p1  ORF type:complete len:1037 (-),score=247.94 TRINITY_DN1549_c0_g1_i1:184-3228(-)
MSSEGQDGAAAAIAEPPEEGEGEGEGIEDVEEGEAAPPIDDVEGGEEAVEAAPEGEEARPSDAQGGEEAVEAAPEGEEARPSDAQGGEEAVEAAPEGEDARPSDAQGGEEAVEAAPEGELLGSEAGETEQPDGVAVSPEAEEPAVDEPLGVEPASEGDQQSQTSKLQDEEEDEGLRLDVGTPSSSRSGSLGSIFGDSPEPYSEIEAHGEAEHKTPGPAVQGAMPRFVAAPCPSVSPASVSKVAEPTADLRAALAAPPRGSFSNLAMASRLLAEKARSQALNLEISPDQHMALLRAKSGPSSPSSPSKTDRGRSLSPGATSPTGTETSYAIQSPRDFDFTTLPGYDARSSNVGGAFSFPTARPNQEQSPARRPKPTLAQSIAEAAQNKHAAVELSDEYTGILTIPERYIINLTYYLDHHAGSTVTQLFLSADVDKSGFLLVEELRDLMQGVLRAEINDEHMRLITEYIDVNATTKEATITLKEFEQAVDRTRKKFKTAKEQQHVSGAPPRLPGTVFSDKAQAPPWAAGVAAPTPELEFRDAYEAWRSCLQDGGSASPAELAGGHHETSLCSGKSTMSLEGLAWDVVRPHKTVRRRVASQMGQGFSQGYPAAAAPQRRQSTERAAALVQRPQQPRSSGTTGGAKGAQGKRSPQLSALQAAYAKALGAGDAARLAKARPRGRHGAEQGVSDQSCEEDELVAWQKPVAHVRLRSKDEENIARSEHYRRFLDDVHEYTITNAECTFQPKITRRASVLNRSHRNGMPEEATQRHELIREKIGKLGCELSMKEVQDCSFRPKITDKAKKQQRCHQAGPPPAPANELLKARRESHLAEKAFKEETEHPFRPELAPYTKTLNKFQPWEPISEKKTFAYESLCNEQRPIRQCHSPLPVPPAKLQAFSERPPSSGKGMTTVKVKNDRDISTVQDMVEQWQKGVEKSNVRLEEELERLVERYQDDDSGLYGSLEQVKAGEVGAESAALSGLGQLMKGRSLMHKQRDSSDCSVAGYTTERAAAAMMM